MKGPRPKPTTLTALYRKHAAADAHPAAILKWLLHLSPRRQRCIRARIRGESLTDIGRIIGQSASTAHSEIRQGMRWIHARIARLPRYRPGTRKGAGPRPAARKAATWPTATTAARKSARVSRRAQHVGRRG
jgi:hypothetical protein